MDADRDRAGLVGATELGDVGPGGEDPLAARDDDRPRWIRVQRRRGLAELGQQRLGEGVDLAVGQRDDGDAVVATIEVEQLCHGLSLADRRSVLGNRPERADPEGQNGVDFASPRSPPRESVRALLQLMARQHGVASTSQSRALGVSRRVERRLLADGTLQSPCSGVLTVGEARR